MESVMESRDDRLDWMGHGEMVSLEDRIEAAKNGFKKFYGKPFREYQLDAIKFIVESKKKVVVCCLPTGAGKSLIGATAASVMGGGIYMVHSKPLQIQLQDDFSELPILWGRGNYRCLQSQLEASCGECGHSSGYPCGHKNDDCYYTVAKKKALRSNIKILNYDYWMTETNYVGQFSGEDLIIVDEADSLENAISKFIGLDFSYGMMRLIGIGPPKYKTTSSDKSIGYWKAWAHDAEGKVSKMLKELGAVLSCEHPDGDLLKRRERLSGIWNKLQMFIGAVDESWIYDEKSYDGRVNISFRPKWINEELAYKFIWGKAGKFVLMSATFPPLPVLAKELGLKMVDMAYKEFPSTFPVENRPIVLHPVVNVTHKTEDKELYKAIDAIRYLLGKHKVEKGLIHTVSYKLRDMVMGIGDERLVTHNGGDKIESIEAFKRSDKPLVMVSPSSERGISLDGDMCRWCVWLKAPYLSLGDKLVSARVYRDYIGNMWYKSNAIQTVVQGCGRLVRSKEDYGIVYVLDAQIVKLLTENPSMAPMWWREAIA